MIFFTLLLTEPRVVAHRAEQLLLNVLSGGVLLLGTPIVGTSGAGIGKHTLISLEK